MNEKQKIKQLKDKIRKAKRELRLLQAFNRSEEGKLIRHISQMLGELFDITDPVIGEKEFNTDERVGRSVITRMSIDPTLSETDNEWDQL